MLHIFRFLVRNALPKSLAILAALAASPACTAPHTPSVWVGATFPHLQRAFGDPEAVLINSNNNRVYAFRELQDQSTSTNTPLVYGEGTTKVTAAGCLFLFELAEKTVVGWDWQGPSCGDRPIPLPYQTRQLD